MSNKLINEKYLQHVGVKGMRWGVRKGKKPTKKRRMSNKELNARIKRLKLEREYAKLSIDPRIELRMNQAAKISTTVATLSGSALAIYKNLGGVATEVNRRRNG